LPGSPSLGLQQIASEGMGTPTQEHQPTQREQSRRGGLGRCRAAAIHRAIPKKDTTAYRDVDPISTNVMFMETANPSQPPGSTISMRTTRTTGPAQDIPGRSSSHGHWYFEHTMGHTQAFSTCVTTERHYAAVMKDRRRVRARVKWKTSDEMVNDHHPRNLCLARGYRTGGRHADSGDRGQLLSRRRIPDVSHQVGQALWLGIRMLVRSKWIVPSGFLRPPRKRGQHERQEHF